jgi:hypothetical protein
MKKGIKLEKYKAEAYSLCDSIGTPLYIPLKEWERPTQLEFMV